MSGTSLSVISVLTPVHDTDPQMLRDCIEHVLHQTYPYWELCLADDGSTRQDTLDVLNHYEGFDDRIKVVHLETNQGISAASNAALALATGEFVALLDHDDVLDLEALGAIGHVLHYEPYIDVIYTNEDKFVRLGGWADAYHKPAWSPEALLEQMYIGHLTVYRRTVVNQVGGFRLGFEGSQDWDLALRVTELTQRVRHIDKVLYHWRVHPGSVAAGADAKPYAAIAAERALNEALERRGIAGRAIYHPEIGHFEVRREITERRTVSVVIPTAGGSRVVRGQSVRLIDLALRSLVEHNDYPEIEIVVVLSPGTDPDLADELRPIVGDTPITFLPTVGRFDFAAAVNRGVFASTGELVLMLNDDIEAITPDWLTRLVEAMDNPLVGIAGPQLLFADGTVQHAGVVHNKGLPFHLQRLDPAGPGYFSEVQLTRNYLAVTGACLLTTRELYDEVGGLSPVFPMNYNDIDFCMKVHVAHKRCVYVGESVLFHYESSSREPSVTVQEIHEYHRVWHDLTDPDPYLPMARIP